MADEAAESATTEEKPAKATKATKAATKKTPGAKKKAKPTAKKKGAGRKKSVRKKRPGGGGKKKATRASKKTRAAKKTKATPRGKKKTGKNKSRRGRKKNAWTLLQPADLKNYLKANNLSFKGFGELVGTTQVTVSNWVKGNNAPTEQMQKRIQKLLAKPPGGAAKPKPARKKPDKAGGHPAPQPEPVDGSGSALVDELLAAAKRMEDLAAHVGQELGQIDAAIDQLRHSGRQRRDSPPL